MGRDDEAREKDGANAETTRGAHACRHTAVAGVALCLALAAAVAFAGRRGGIASRPAAALGERYVNECNLFGCRTVHAQLPPRRLAAVPGIQQELSGRRPLGSSALVQHRTDQPTTLAGAASKLKALEQELVKENATAVAAWNAVSVIHRDMQTIEDQTHVDGVEIRRQHALLAHEEGLLGKEMGKESTEKSGLAAARTQLRQARERQARVLAEAQKYRAALTAATQKLVSFKKAASARLVGWSMPPCCIHMRGRVIGQDAFSPNVWFSDLNYKQVAVFDCGPGGSCVSLVLDRLTAGLRLKSHSCTS